jgi:hypothetical protein|tara:strand:+ start:1513 stop:2370 length:858 start_codon:yes stop_codon:yes gene_type:complete
MGKSAKNKQNQLSEKMFASTEKQLERYNDEQIVQRELLEKQKAKYRNFEFKNPYADMQNPFEDITIDQRAAEYQNQQGQQQRANILSTLRGAAGGSGVAGLAQAMANQGQLQTQQISAGIGQQERQNNIFSAKMAGQIDMTERGGEAMVQSAQMGRQSTLLGIEYGGMAGANAGVQSAYANQMSGFGAQASMLNSQVAANAAITSSVISAIPIPPSDRRLKKSINKIGESPSGLNIYSFEFKDSKYGEGTFQGVMSDEVPREVVGTRDGYDTVDYSKLDIEFKQI